MLHRVCDFYNAVMVRVRSSGLGKTYDSISGQVYPAAARFLFFFLVILAYVSVWRGCVEGD